MIQPGLIYVFDPVRLHIWPCLTQGCPRLDLAQLKPSFDLHRFQLRIRPSPRLNLDNSWCHHTRILLHISVETYLAWVEHVLKLSFQSSTVETYRLRTRLLSKLWKTNLFTIVSLFNMPNSITLWNCVEGEAWGWGNITQPRKITKKKCM